MNGLLALSRGIDRLSERFGWIADWMVLLACLVSAGNAAVRYLFSYSSNGWLEIQWYMFAAMFLLGAPWTLKVNEHVRVDILYAYISERAKLWVDVLGLILFLLPAMVILTLMTWPFFRLAWQTGEVSVNAGGLITWPVKLLMPVGFALISLQGISELVKRIAALRGMDAGLKQYEAPLQ